MPTGKKAHERLLTQRDDRKRTHCDANLLRQFFVGLMTLSVAFPSPTTEITWLPAEMADRDRYGEELTE